MLVRGWFLTDYWLARGGSWQIIFILVGSYEVDTLRSVERFLITGHYRDEFQLRYSEL